MGIRPRADLDSRVAVGEAVEPRRSHQHRGYSDGGVDLLVPVVDDARLHQIGDPVADRPRMDAETLLAAEGGGHRLRYRAEAELDRRVAAGPRQFRVDLRDYQPRPADRRVQMLDAEPGIVPPRFVRAADLHQHEVDRQAATEYEAADIGNIGRYDVVGAAGEKPSPCAGAAQCGDGDVGVVGGEAVAEGQREKNAEWRATLRLRVKQAGD